jgi:hypothetical protein
MIHDPPRPLSVDERDALAELVADRDAPYVAAAVHARDVEAFADRVWGLPRHELIVLVAVLAERWPAARSRPDDGVVDEVAVTRAIGGEPVPMSRSEREFAVKLMADRGANVTTISERLHLSGQAVNRILGRDKPTDQHQETLLMPLDGGHAAACEAPEPVDLTGFEAAAS